MDVFVTKVDKGELLFLDNPHYEEVICSYLEGVKMEDSDQTQNYLCTLIILGTVDHMRAKTPEKPRVGKMGGTIAERTKLGWTILAQAKELDYLAMFFTETGQSNYEELCRLDVLELAD